MYSELITNLENKKQVSLRYKIDFVGKMEMEVVLDLVRPGVVEGQIRKLSDSRVKARVQKSPFIKLRVKRKLKGPQIEYQNAV